MKINGLKKKALWEDIKCCCIKGDIEHTYPLSECKHCKFMECWLSVPHKDFIVKDEKGKDHKVKEINLIRGSFEDIIGWSF
jgi:hypothetical protein